MAYDVSYHEHELQSYLHSSNIQERFVIHFFTLILSPINNLSETCVYKAKV